VRSFKLGNVRQTLNFFVMLFCRNLASVVFAFSALTLFVGYWEEHPASEK